ncbi:GAF domain-containing sensor histidine kinase [Roseibium album]|uniref:GAF domain-containing sensor histidine kinase n=1 Tax=Roseibium album TaxID=311410 RepID=UPI002490E848|nr:GAF domain-containing sensor histidine kinase [Roseibium album]
MTDESTKTGASAISAEAMLQRFLLISRAVAGQLDFQSLIQKVSEEVGFFLPHDHIDVCILTGERDMHVAYEARLHTGWGEAPEPVPVSFSPIRSILRGEEEFILTADAQLDERFHFDGAFSDPIFDARLRSRLHVPLQVEGKVIGALSYSCHARGIYEDSHVTIAQYVADLLSSYIHALNQGERARKAAIRQAEIHAHAEGLRAGALRLTEALEQERQRIGMDLHDQTLADLTRLNHELRRLRQSPKIPGEALNSLTDRLEGCLQELRSIIEDARPSVLKLFGFEEGIEALLERAIASQARPIAVKFSDETGGTGNSLQETLQIALFRITQEAVNNAIKHADASRISVCLSQADGYLCLSITDNGLGLVSDDTDHLGGIENMRTRATLISAEFSIEPAEKSSGTCVRVMMPVTNLTKCPITEPERNNAYLDS